jgi:hypothetical protein
MQHKCKSFFSFLFACLGNAFRAVYCPVSVADPSVLRKGFEIGQANKLAMSRTIAEGFLPQDNREQSISLG